MPRYKFFTTFGRLAREQGMMSLWRGNLPYQLRHVPSITISFAFKDAFKDLFPNYDPKHNFWSFLGANVASGALAGAVALTLVYPFEVATIKMAAQVHSDPHKTGPGMMAVLRSIAQQRGVVPGYQGYCVTLTSMMAYKALYFGLYDTAKGLIYHGETEEGSLLTKLLIASGTVLTAASLTYPFDIIRKRLVVDAHGPDGQYIGFCTMR